MKALRVKLLAATVLGGMLAVAQATEITGAGASFPAPLYAKWADAYQKATGVKLNYQSIGSSGGIRQIKAKTVDFGASDAPLKQDELDKDGMIQFPMAMGGVVPVMNLAGVQPGQIRMTPAILADIYLGKITKWNDKALTDLNPSVKLPDQNISVVRRADGSGTTFIFTNYLSKISADWKQRVGEGATVNWPVGLGGKGNEGVAAFIQRIPASIGYVEYSYAKKNKLTFALLQNKAGNYVAPDDLTFKAAAAGAKWNESFAQILTDQAGKDAWPITGATFILLYKNQEKAQQGAEVLKFFDWAYKNGDKMAEELDYVPMPENVANLVRAQWSSSVKDGAGKALFSSK
ncbi:phosphate ABC transporter substrate-binding protein PstS [Parvibium lacunae]|uniref:Phosphate-binding protein PstS n=1 Tax=Parvibium lacunae TaxID=1888893 RepID=A0A368L3L2_9BURK|nr:phosphate ABC transporter substrate-binding protein PstS [Parvibium lacunae]RCS58115.1 phosphate ABC transporter substrate-binding protein PstS [Parvibium lacunae]